MDYKQKQINKLNSVVSVFLKTKSFKFYIMRIFILSTVTKTRGNSLKLRHVYVMFRKLMAFYLQSIMCCIVRSQMFMIMFHVAWRNF